ncbi:MAG TPA: SLBB domain-containing protein [Ignavibacteriales bacterium]|nr:SLBB domain-containing protein [Ignavibacteriales bacterium]
MNKRIIILLALFIPFISVLPQQADEAQARKKAAEMGISYDQYLKLKSAYEQNQKKKIQTRPNESESDVLKELSGAKKQKAGKLSGKEPQYGMDSLAIREFLPEEFYAPEFKNRPPADTLNAFGYNIFTYKPTSFEPLDVPVPSNYIVGPGDELVVTLWGETEVSHNLVVSSDGSIFIPDVGLIHVGGLTISQVKTKLFGILSQRYSSLSVSAGGSTSLNVSTGELRSVKVFIVGEVNTPGGYTLPALSTAFTALYFGGGPAITGSLRNVRLMRNGKQVYEIDLYDYLTSGDKSKDIRLEDEDVIYVPPVGKRAAISGGIKRPGIYEIKDNETVNDLIAFAGGFTFDPYVGNIGIERIVPFSERRNYKNDVLNLDLKFNSYEELKNSTQKIEDGDLVRVYNINYLYENKVSIWGNVKNQGDYELTKDMTVKDLVIKADSLSPKALYEKAVLFRTLSNERKEVISFNVFKALRGDPKHDIKLENRDEIQIYNRESFFPMGSVRIMGAVRDTGFYTRFENMRLTDLILVAGGLNDSASILDIEITRMDTTDPLVYGSTYSIDLPEDYWNLEPEKDFALQDYDRVLIKTNPKKRFPQSIVISGEVIYPGEYTILNENEKLVDYIKRSGGFMSTAYTKGIYVKRYNPIFEKVRKPDIPDSLISFQGTFDRSLFKDYSYRIPILWDEIEDDENSIYNFRLEPNDSIFVPKDPHRVFVLGEVGLPSSVIYKEGAGLDYYIEQAGGFTENSYKGNEIVMLPNGSKWRDSGWFFLPDDEILSGSVIIVPTIFKGDTNYWATVRDIVSVISSAAVLILTIQNIN